MSDINAFCTRCGRNLSEIDRYCPECGMKVPGRTPEEDKAEEEAIKGALSTRLNIAVAMILIYSIPLLIVGLYILVDASTISDALFPTYQEHFGYTQDEMDLLVKWSGYSCIISSVLGIAAAALSYKRRAYWAAVFLCIVSMFSGVLGFLALFMGMIAFWLILTSKPLFDAEKEPASDIGTE